jgi:hypothetical protein
MEDRKLAGVEGEDGGDRPVQESFGIRVGAKSYT